MKATFGSRRKARKVGQDEDDEDAASDDSEPIVKRPASTKPKKKSNLRLSFGPGQEGGGQDLDDSPEIFTPKKRPLSHKVLEKNAIQKSLAHSISHDRLPIRSVSPEESDKPSYSREFLDELRNSTPSTPKNVGSLSEDEAEGAMVSMGGRELDIAAKFGSQYLGEGSAHIPTDAEIREKKERRKRLAKEQDFIGLSGDEEEEGSRELTYHELKDLEKENTRLQRDDEDIMEGFEDYVDDGRISLSKQGQRSDRDKRRVEMQNLIAEAEGSSESSEDSEAEMKMDYELTQTQAGTFGQTKPNRPRRPHTPPKITPLPTLQGCLERLNADLSTIEYQLTLKSKQLADIRQEKVDIINREAELRKMLEESRTKKEDKEEGEGDTTGNGQLRLTTLSLNGTPQHHSMFTDRGLESWGNTPIATPRPEEDS